MTQKVFLHVWLLCWPFSISAQFVELTSMPEPVSNNAVVGIERNGAHYLYSFGGIDSSGTFSGIHPKAWCYDVEKDIWMNLPDVPDPSGGKIGASASYVNGRIYLIGGYHVDKDGRKSSSGQVHVFDPLTHSWLSDAAQTLIPINDHVQAVWRDSLIYVISGWSNSENVIDVQVFNPVLNTWKSGTTVPDSTDYKVYGASGIIVGDTIFYAGGVSHTPSCQTSSFFRMGVIDPDNPLQIRWSGFSNQAVKGYRMAVAEVNKCPVWLGGSHATCHFEGSECQGPGAEEALDRISQFHSGSQSFYQSHGNIPFVMDLCGSGQISQNEVILTGGRDAEHKVSNKVWKVRLDDLTGIQDVSWQDWNFELLPNPAGTSFTIACAGWIDVEVYSEKGDLVYTAKGTDLLVVQTEGWEHGLYWVQVNGRDGTRATEEFEINQ